MSFVPQVGMAELFLLAMLALVVVGPKELPRLMRSIGRGIAKARSLADEFRASFDQMAREAEIEDMRKEIEALKAANPAAMVREAMQDIDDSPATTNPSKPARDTSGTET